MKIVATKYNYNLVLALNAIEFVEEEDSDYTQVKNIVDQVSDGKLRIICNEEFEYFSELKKVKILNEFLSKHPDHISAKHELIYAHKNVDHKEELFLKFFAREKDHIENESTYAATLSIEELRITIMYISRFYKSIGDNDNLKKLLEWSSTKGLNGIAKGIVEVMYDLDTPIPSVKAMEYYDEVQLWTHNLLIFDLFEDLEELPYNLDFLGMINWEGMYFDHDLYLRILDSDKTHIKHDIRWLFYQNLIAYQKEDLITEMSGFLALINFINHFELSEFVELAITSIISMPENIFRSMVYDIESVYLNDLIMGLLKLDSEKVIETLMDDGIIDEIEDDFQPFALRPIFGVIASLTKQQNEEGENFLKYFKQLDSYYKKHRETRQWLISEGESYNYTGLKELVDSAYEKGQMDFIIFSNEPDGETEESIPITYDKKTYFKKIDEEFNTTYTSKFVEDDIDKLVENIKNEIKYKLEKSVSEREDEDFGFFEGFDEDFDGDFDGDLSWIADHQANKKDAEIIPITFKRNDAKVGRNDPCPCGSGKKYKKCCLNK